MWSRSWDHNCPHVTSRSKLRVLHSIEKTSTNNQAEYHVVLKGIKLLREVNAEVVEIFGDSQLVINQLAGEYEFNDGILRVYHEEFLQLLREFKIVKLEHIPKCHNSEANRLAQEASRYRPILTMELSAEDWRKEIINYLKGPSKKVDKQLYRAIKYVLLEDELYYCHTRFPKKTECISYVCHNHNFTHMIDK
jgi:ribonuclease HI